VKTNRLVLFREVIAAYFVRHMKHTNTHTNIHTNEHTHTQTHTNTHTHTQMTPFGEMQSLLILHVVVYIHTIYL